MALYKTFIIINRVVLYIVVINNYLKFNSSIMQVNYVFTSLLLVAANK